MVASPPSSIIGCAAQNHAHSTPERHARPSVPLAHATNSHPIGAVSASCPPSFLISICFLVRDFVPPLVIPAIVISSHMSLAHFQNFSAQALHLSANSSAHTKSATHAIAGQVIFLVVKSSTFPVMEGICSHALKAPVASSFAPPKNHKSSHSGISLYFASDCLTISFIPSTFIPLF